MKIWIGTLPAVALLGSLLLQAQVGVLSEASAINNMLVTSDPDTPQEPIILVPYTSTEIDEEDATYLLSPDPPGRRYLTPSQSGDIQATTTTAAAASINSFQLRAAANMDTLKNKVTEARIQGDKAELAQATANAIRGSAALLEEARAESEVALARIPDQETTSSEGWAEPLVGAYQSAMTQVGKALDVVPQMINFMENTAQELAAGKEQPQKQEEPLPAPTPAMVDEQVEQMLPEDDHDTSTQRRRGLQPSSHMKKSAPTTHEQETPSSMGHRHIHMEAAKHRRILRNNLQGNPHGKNHFDRVDNFRHMFENGDHSAMHRHLAPVHSRLANNIPNNRIPRRDNEMKAKQCKILTDCVGSMSIYDLILYFYSDDIDPSTGKIDDNIYRHVDAKDMHELYHSYDLINARRGTWNKKSWRDYDNDLNRINCDKLLRNFARNVEFGAVPHWEGGTVNEVCLAQGSHTYVQLSEIAMKVGFKAADETAKEMFTCTKDLYNDDACPRLAPFPFSREEKIRISVFNSKVVEKAAVYKGLNMGVIGKQDNHAKLFDNNDSTYYETRSGRYGKPTQLKIKNNDKCMDYDSSSEDSGDRRIDFKGCSSSEDSQQWYYDHETEQIKNRHEGKCLQEFSSTDRVKMRTCDSSSDDQKWKKLKDDHIQTENRGGNEIIRNNDDNRGYLTSYSKDSSDDFYKVKDEFFDTRIDPSAEFWVAFQNEDNYEVKTIELKWKKNEECPDSKVRFKNGWEGGDIPATWGTTQTETMTIKRAQVTQKTYRLRIFCDDPGKRVALYAINVYGIPETPGSGTNSNPLPQFVGTYIEDFVVPTGIETDTSRDDYGQVKSSSATLYKYDGGNVHTELSSKQTVMQGTYRDFWNDWLKAKNTNLKKRLHRKYGAPGTKYEDADSYMALVIGESKTYNEVKKQLILAHAKEMGKSSWDFEDKEELYDSFNQEVEEAYASVQNGFNLVFGKDASVGYVCGIYYTVERYGKNKFPGTCCLDAPYQNPGHEWGREYDCSMTCQREAPFFNGLSEESCSAVGGTWCPSPTNCQVLQKCINDEIQEAKSERKLAYETYLEPGVIPTGKHTEYDSCSSAREYFGFDPNYKNDEDICDNIKQLKNTKDFAFLDEVYGQGTPIDDGSGLGGAGYYDGDNDYKHYRISAAEWDALKEPDTETSTSDAVQDAGKEGTALFALEVVLVALSGAVDFISEFTCWSEPISNGPCTALKNVAFMVAHVVKQVLEQLILIWGWCLAEASEIGNVEPFENWEVLQVQHKNNKLLYEGMRTTFNAVLQHDGNLEGLGDLVSSMATQMDEIQENGKNIEKRLEEMEAAQGQRSLMSSSGRNAQNSGCDGRDQDNDGIIDNCEEDNFPPQIAIQAALEVKEYEGTKHVAGEMFSSIDEALASLKGALTVVDDCAGKKSLALNLTLKETKECQAVISAAPIQWCNDASIAGEIEDFSVAIDTQAPAVNCSFSASTVPGGKVLYMVEGDDDFFDAGLSLHVGDSCSDKVDVDVTVMSNELDTTGPSAVLALIKGAAGDQPPTGVVPELFLNQATCNSTNKKTGFCKKSAQGGRVYEVTVKATDTTGWSAKDTCHVIVAPKEEVASNRLLVERELNHNDDVIPSPEEQIKLVKKAGVQRQLESISYVHHL